MEADERFAEVDRDPRFKRIKKQERRVKIDKRFEKMFTDKSFHTRFTKDKRGKKMPENEVEDLNKFYELNDEEDKEEDDMGDRNFTLDDRHGDDGDNNSNRNNDGDSGDNDKDEETTSKKTKPKRRGKLLANVTNRNTILSSAKKKKGKLFKPNVDKIHPSSNSSGSKINFDDIRGETLPDDYESSSSSENDDDLEDGDIDEGQIVHGWGDLDENVKCLENAETRRIAVCNCDWDRVGAHDLYMLFNSFKPADGEVLNVKVFPSEFGKQRMEEEKVLGPKELVLDKVLADGDDETANSSGEEEKEEGSEFHMEKLREYQMNRLKYYYAVVECNSMETANKLYEELDGQEYEMSATRLDLRFIPDEMTFDDTESHSIASENTVMGKYEPVTFHNTALQQSTVRLTWDETDPKRVQTMMRKLDAEEIENMDFKDYLASASEDDYDNDDDDEGFEGEEKGSKIEAYKKLLLELDNPTEEKDEKTEDEEDMEVLFKSSKNKENKDTDKVSKFTEMTLKNNSLYKNNDVDDDDESEIEMESEVEDEDLDNGDGYGGILGNGKPFEEGNDIEDGFNDPFFNNDSTKKNEKKKKRKKDKKKTHHDIENENLSEGDKKKKNELELLIMDEEEDKKHFHLKEIMDREKSKKLKRKNKKGKDGEELKMSDDFEIDVCDPRFGAMYSSHLYSIDPSDPNFKRTKATQAIIDESQKRRKTPEIENTKKTKLNDNSASSNSVGKLDPKLSEMVNSVKSKTALHRWKKKKKKAK